MTANGERLTLVGADGSHLTFAGEGGRRFRLEVDDELRDAVRRCHTTGSASTSSAGPEEAIMDTSLRPRDIQARIRAGATAEEIAEASGATVEKVLVYARPVLAERAHMSQRAQRSSVRSAGDGSSGHRTLGDAVAKRLRGINEDPGSVEWDSRKREDGRWVLTASFATADRAGLARFTFDPPGNFVTLDDEDARWLLGDEVELAAGPTDTTDAAGTTTTGDPDPGDPADGVLGGRRLVAVADEELPLGGDALHLVDHAGGQDGDDGEYATYTVEPDQTATTDLTETADQLRSSDDESPSNEESDGAEDEQPSRRRVRKRGGRASVPTWDEIMFGGRRE